MNFERLEYRVLVCGGRHYDKSQSVNAALEMVWTHSIGILVIIEGGATGADQWAAEWAENHQAFGVLHEAYPAQWRERGFYNPSAGFERNKKMIEEGKPDLGIWFPGGNGTADMVSKLKAAGIQIIAGENIQNVREVVSGELQA